MTHQRTLPWIAALPTLLLAGVVVVAVASPLNVPHTFTPNTVADANHVNQNFAAVKTAVDDNDSRIATNNTRITALEGLPPHVLAAAHVSSSGVTVTRQFSRLPGAPTITVSSAAPGSYRVDFGADVSGRYYSASLGHSGVTGHPTLFGGQISVSPRVTDNQILEVITTNSSGGLTDISFYVVVY